jgi:murein DD-endopeptidase MepM/ murein hydrolase activator NlpD
VLEFLPPREVARTKLAWPTLNRLLFSDPARFFSRTRANPDYGKPGWTRDCGRRFHRGCDIAPVNPRPAGWTTKVWFTDCARDLEYPSDEPVFTVDEPVFAVAAGEVTEVNGEESASEFGLYVVLRHRGPGEWPWFETLYAHLGAVVVSAGARVSAGQEIGRMGQTSSIADARNWLAVAPHLHFEAWSEDGSAYDPVELLQNGLSPPESTV